MPLTDEDRVRGGRKSGEVRRAKRAKAEAKAEERFVAMLDKAFARHEKLFASEDDSAAMRAVREAYDRALGRVAQRLEHGGPDGEAIVVEHRLDVQRRRAVLEGLVDAGLIQPGRGGDADPPPDEVHPA